MESFTITSDTDSQHEQWFQIKSVGTNPDSQCLYVNDDSEQANGSLMDCNESKTDASLLFKIELPSDQIESVTVT